MWKDITSYQQSDTERKPTTFEAKAGSLRIVIVHGHIYYPGQWIMFCLALDIKTFPLGNSDLTLDQAKANAIKIVRNQLTTLLECVDLITNT